MSAVLDTNVVIDLLRGREEALPLLEGDREPLTISAITAHEIYAGMRSGEEEMTRAMLSSFALLPYGSREAELSGAWWKDFRAEGITLDFRDLAIAATAVARSLPLLTSNAKDFPMPELRVEQWPPTPQGV